MKINYKKLSLLLLFEVAFLFSAVIGGSMNEFVMQQNNNKMPVLTTDFNYTTDIYFTYQDKSSVNYWILTDFIKTNNTIASIGDIFLLISASGTCVVVGFFVFGYAYKRRYKHEHNK